MPTKAALEFWAELTIFSAKFLERMGLESSTWGGPQFQPEGKPKGVVYHYTSSSDFERTLKWFCNASFNSGVSAHAVVLPFKHAWHDEFAVNSPAIASLPVTVIQCRRPTVTAHHATWMNREFYGIENVNAGRLKQNEDGAWASKRGEVVAYADRTDAWGAGWETYPAGQVAVNITLTRMLCELFPEKIKPAFCIGHECGQGVATRNSSHKDKRDPGPLFPVWGVRESVFHEGLRLPVDGYPWWADFTGDPWYGRTWREERILGALAYEPGVAVDVGARLRQFRGELAAWSCNARSPFGALGKVALQLLGYHAVAGRLVTSEDYDSLYLFRRMAGMKYDSDPATWTEGESSLKTRKALFARLEDRGVWSSNYQ